MWSIYAVGTNEADVALHAGYVAWYACCPAATRHTITRRIRLARLKTPGGAQVRTVLSDWPVKRPRDWTSWVSQQQSAAELASLRDHVRRSRPYGDEAWGRQPASKLNLQWTLHRRVGYRRQKVQRSEETL